MFPFVKLGYNIENVHYSRYDIVITVNIFVLNLSFDAQIMRFIRVLDCRDSYDPVTEFDCANLCSDLSEEAKQNKESHHTKLSEFLFTTANEFISFVFSYFLFRITI